MSEAFLGEIRAFAGTYAPMWWAFCAGQSLSIIQYPALFSLLGTAYGGDGIHSFALPDLRQRVPLHHGRSTGPDRHSYILGQMGGIPDKIITEAHIPPHTHNVVAVNSAATEDTPGPDFMLAKAVSTSGRPGRRESDMYSSEEPEGAIMNQRAVTEGDDGLPYDNHQPSLVCHYIMAVELAKGGDIYYPNRR